jgi:hypothetical protein
MAEERRKSLLTESDFDKIGEQFDQRQTKILELIGYDVTTPESRDAIRTDHKFVRYLRKGTLWVVGVGSAAYITAAAAGWVG